MPAIYPYKSLNQKAKEIRILRFDLQDFTSDKLICSIEHVSLLDKDVVPYVAASYTWGKATSRNMINIDGIEVSIPENSNIALRNLSSLRSKRHHYPGTSETTIVDSLAGGCRVWMDAICINQNDLEERTQQVSLMGDIYTKASAVLIWLGEDPQGLAGAAFETICQIQRTGEPFIAAVTRQGDGLGRHMWMPDQKSLPIPINWSSLQSLFSAPWFERVWTIQEAILNKQTFAVFGDHLCAYSHVHMVSLFLVKKHNYELVLKGRMPGLDLAATRESFAGINDAKKNSPENLTGMLSSLHLFSATENKDRIFSFMGIIDKRVRSIILPSYNYTLAEVYARATVASITVNGLLTAFTYAANSLKPDGGKEADDNLPSWAIKCHWKWTSNVLPIRIFSRRPVEECRYDFSELPGRVASTGWRVLPLQGVIIDEIVDTSPVITPEIINDDKAMQDFNDMWLVLTQILDGDNSELEIIKKLLGVGAPNRKFLWTQKGRVGRGMPTTQPGDLVCDLLGGEVHFILRREGDFFRLIGDCWLEGVGNDLIDIVMDKVPRDSKNLTSFNII